MIDAKNHLIVWWVLAILSLFLWYRNILYDRIIAIFIFFVGLVELIQYGIESGASINTSNKVIFILLWSQCLILAVGLYIFLKDDENNFYKIITLLNLIIFAIIFLFAVLFIIIANPDFSNNQGNLLGYFNVIYIIGIILPLIILFSYYEFSNIGLIFSVVAILILVGIILIYVNIDQFNTYFNYFLIVVAFITFFSGMINSAK